MSKNLKLGVVKNMLFSCFFCNGHSLLTGGVKKYFLIRFKSYLPELKSTTGIWLHHWLIANCCFFGNISKSYVGKYFCLIFFLKTSPRLTTVSQNFCTNSSGAFEQMCSGFLLSVTANDTDTGTCSFSKTRSCVATVFFLLDLDGIQNHIQLHEGTPHSSFLVNDHSIIVEGSRAPNEQLNYNPLL